MQFYVSQKPRRCVADTPLTKGSKYIIEYLLFKLL
jgi:hypothetical protein